MRTKPPREPDATTPRDAAEGLAIEAFPLGPFETNCYLVYERAGAGPVTVIDAGFEPGEMIDRLRELGRPVDAIVLTHAHVDHIAGINEVLDAFPGTPVLIHRAEKDWLGDPVLNLGIPIGLSITARGPDRLIDEGETLTIGGRAWRVLHTPGHSPGGITLHSPGVALVGDALFAGSVGRTDFPGSDMSVLSRSIREKLYTLPGETVVYPGHGPATTIARERATNPFVRG
ncbi:MAG: MBL fold metallo-hydrolase [Phycisphaerales bacterium]